MKVDPNFEVDPRLAFRNCDFTVRGGVFNALLIWVGIPMMEGSQHESSVASKGHGEDGLCPATWRSKR